MFGEGLVILDGAFGTLLEEEYNIKLDSFKWSCICLEKDPELVSKIHFNYFSSG
jgi:S-methylmethionine-dependent homocysteine/selenocysteine methylase